MDFFTAIVLGVLEGLTEFLPISSTGHLILVSSQLAVDPQFSKLFNVVIQLGAVLAILVLYWRTFLRVLVGLPKERSAQHFVRNLLLAVSPALVIGAFAHDYIKQVLFDPMVVAVALVVGGVAILLIERYKPQPRITATEQMGWRTALTVGFLQCLAMIPGVSRSGATIMGALLVGVERRAAAEFSFFLAVPTMTAAVAYDLYKGLTTVPEGGAALLAVGFAAAFATALLVVRTVMGFITRHGYAPFAYYRIGLGLLLAALLSSGIVSV